MTKTRQAPSLPVSRAVVMNSARVTAQGRWESASLVTTSHGDTGTVRTEPSSRPGVLPVGTVLHVVVAVAARGGGEQGQVAVREGDQRGPVRPGGGDVADLRRQDVHGLSPDPGPGGHVG